jgi:low affinity Fe/Cu permease
MAKGVKQAEEKIEEVVIKQEETKAEPVTDKLGEIKKAVAWVEEMGAGNTNIEARAFQKIKEILSK